MKISAGKRYKKIHRSLNAIFISNPALILGFAMPFLIATSTSLKNAVAMSVEMLCLHIATMMFAVVFTRKLPAVPRAAITAAVATLVMMLTRELIIIMFGNLANSLGTYIYLLPVNGLTMFQSLSLSKHSRPLPVLRRELYHVLAFVLTIFSLSLMREYFGGSTLWGVPVSAPFKLGGLLIPFSGFILLGFLMAFIKFFNHKFFAVAINESYLRQTRVVATRNNNGR